MLKDAGALDEITSQIRFLFKPGPGFEANLTMSRDQEQVEYPFTMYPFPPSPGFEYAYVGYKDGAMPVMEIMSISPDRGEMHLRPLFGLTSDARQNVAALTFRSAFLNADEVTLTAELFESNGMRIGRPADRTRPGVREEVEHALAIYEEIAFLEERLGVSLPAHDPPVTAAEIQLLAHATATVRNRTGYGGLGMAEWEVAPEQAEAFRATLLSNPTISFDVNANISDTRSSSALRRRHSPTCELSRGLRCSSCPTRWSRSQPTQVAMGGSTFACWTTTRSRRQPRFACLPYRRYPQASCNSTARCYVIAVQPAQPVADAGSESSAVLRSSTDW